VNEFSNRLENFLRVPAMSIIINNQWFIIIRPAQDTKEDNATRGFAHLFH